MPTLTLYRLIVSRQLEDEEPQTCEFVFQNDGAPLNLNYRQTQAIFAVVNNLDRTSNVVHHYLGDVGKRPEIAKATQRYLCDLPWKSVSPLDVTSLIFADPMIHGMKADNPSWFRVEVDLDDLRAATGLPQPKPSSDARRGIGGIFARVMG